MKRWCWRDAPKPPTIMCRPLPLPPLLPPSRPRRLPPLPLRQQATRCLRRPPSTPPPPPLPPPIHLPLCHMLRCLWLRLNGRWCLLPILSRRLRPRPSPLPLRPLQPTLPLPSPPPLRPRPPRLRLRALRLRLWAWRVWEPVRARALRFTFRVARARNGRTCTLSLQSTENSCITERLLKVPLRLSLPPLALPLVLPAEWPQLQPPALMSSTTERSSARRRLRRAPAPRSGPMSRSRPNLIGTRAFKPLWRCPNSPPIRCTSSTNF
jgi:hypothetical protein